MSNKEIFKFADVEAEIIKGVDTIADPVRGTISPKGRNVMYESENGDVVFTNDGATIARAIEVAGTVKSAIINSIKQASFKSNTEVGDGTSTTIVLTQVLIKEGMKMVSNGWNAMDVKKGMEKMGAELLEKLKAKAIKVTKDKDILNVAKISANSDEEIAQNVLRIVKVVGQDGMVFLEDNNRNVTEIVEDTGFKIDSGLFSKELRNNPRNHTASYREMPVLITDKRIYYQEEVETIIKTALLAGYKGICIVARDFIGQALPTLVANHTQGVINIVLIKEPNVTEKDVETLQDLATYLGGKIISEKQGSIVNKLKPEDFVIAEKVFADDVKTLLVSKNKKSKALKTRISALKGELAKNKDDKPLKNRVASLTNGMVTVKIGGATPIETRERAFRYDDSIHAARAAMEDGYLAGGGVTLMSLLNEVKVSDTEFYPMLKKLCEASVRQIAINCGEHVEAIVEEVKTANALYKKWEWGYNANSGVVENLLKAGVIDPYKVTEMAVRNSVSVAAQIIGVDYLILKEGEDVPDEDDKKK